MRETERMTDPIKAKRLARQEARLAMGRLSPSQEAENSQAVCRLILESVVWREAGQAMLYMPMSGEIDIKPLIRKGLETGKAVALPCFSAKENVYQACVIANLGDLVPGKFGIHEPPEGSQKMDTMQLDLAIVGGIAFDGFGGRLGRGGGFFDRLLADIPAKKCGVCFDEQVRPHVPVERHDVKMDMIATPSGWLIPQPS